MWKGLVRERGGLGRDMAGASAGQLVGVNEESPVGIAGVDREHPVVHVLLGTLALVAWSQEPTGRVWGLAGFETSGLSVVVVSVSVSTAVSTISVSTISVSAIKTITIPTTISTITMTISSITIVCVRGCFSLWLSNDSRKKGEGENGLKKRLNLSITKSDSLYKNFILFIH